MTEELLMKNILLVDDKPDIRETLAEFLQDFGHKTEICENGATAAKRVQERNFDLIITDVIMPKKDGFSFLEELRKTDTKKLRKTPVIIITGGSTSLEFQDSLDTLKSKGNKILKKPFTKDQLLKSVNDAFQA